jgi:hypothetical protein
MPQEIRRTDRESRVSESGALRSGWEFDATWIYFDRLIFRRKDRMVFVAVVRT